MTKLTNNLNHWLSLLFKLPIPVIALIVVHKLIVESMLKTMESSANPYLHIAQLVMFVVYFFTIASVGIQLYRSLDPKVWSLKTKRPVE